MKATQELTCNRCKGPIKIGEDYQIFNRPTPRTPYHSKCPSAKVETAQGDTSGTQETTQAPEETAQETTPEDTGPKITRIETIDQVIERRVREILEKYGSGKVIDEKRIRDIIREEAVQDTRITIQRIDGSTVKVEGAHYNFGRLLNLLSAGISVYLHGPAGTGKTTALLQAAEALGIGGEIDTLDPSTPKSAIFGYRTPNGEPVETAFTRTYGRGGLYICDEADNSPGHVQTLFNSALANGHAPAAWGLVARHAGFAFGAAGNTPFRPTPQFPDRRPGSAAFMDRLYFMYWGIDANIERRATGRALVKTPARLGTVRDITAADWGRWVEEIRAWVKGNAPTIQVTPRATLVGLKALAAGETPEEVAHGLVFRGADDTLVAKALEACPLP